MKQTKFFVLTMAMLFALSACEKPIVEEEADLGGQKTTVADANVVIRVSDFRFTPYEDAQQTRTVEDITAYSTRFNFVIYKDGKKVESRSQMKGDDGYGQVSMKLEPGTYKLLVLAHSSLGGNPTLSDPEKIQFTNKLSYSDTFYYYDNLTVTEEAETHNIVLTRASSKLSFTINDAIPSNVKYIYFYYTGGSGVLNAVTGYAGNVDSQQTMAFSTASRTSPATFDVFTFLKEDEGKLQLTVTATDEDNKVVIERQFTDVPMKRNMMTVYSGNFFDHSSQNDFSFTAETGWEVFSNQTYGN